MVYLVNEKWKVEEYGEVCAYCLENIKNALCGKNIHFW